MPLRPTDGREPVDQIGRQAIKFMMMVDGSDEAPVSCFASFPALHNIEGGEVPDKVERMKRFERNRLRFETIASSKFDAGSIEPDASVMVTAADLDNADLV